MYRTNIPENTTIEYNDTYEGETIETRVARMIYNNEPILDGSPLIYTDRRKGVIAETNIRTDRFEVAIENMDKLHTDKLAKRIEMYKTDEKSIQGTGEGTPNN